MAKQRYIKDSFRTDPYIEILNTSEKLLFLYLLTNSHVTIAGIYEITIRQMSFESGITQDRVQQAIDRLSQDGKIIYENNRIILINFIKNQSVNPSVEKGIERVINTLPNWIKDKVGTGCIQAGTYLTLLNLTLPNSTTNEVEEKKVEKKLSVFDETLQEFKKMRLKMRSPMTDKAITLLNNKLEKLSNGNEDIKIKLLEQSIMNGWKSVFELKGQENIDYTDMAIFGQELERNYNGLKAKLGKEKFFELKRKWIDWASLNNKL